MFLVPHPLVYVYMLQVQCPEGILIGLMVPIFLRLDLSHQTTSYHSYFKPSVTHTYMLAALNLGTQTGLISCD